MLFLFVMPESRQLGKLSMWFQIFHESTNSYIKSVSFNCSYSILCIITYTIFINLIENTFIKLCPIADIIFQKYMCNLISWLKVLQWLCCPKFLIKSNLFNVLYKVPYDLALATLIYNPIFSLSHPNFQPCWLLRAVHPISHPLSSHFTYAMVCI